MKQLKIVSRITNRDSTLVDAYFNEINKYEKLTAEEEFKIAQQARVFNDENARSKLVTANLRFVVSVAKFYQSTGIPLLDLINSGNEGLIKASTMFDESRGYKFISYAVWWIRQSITSFINTSGKCIRIPLNKYASLSKINKFSEDFVKLNSREPSKNEVCQGIDMSEDEYSSTLETYLPVSSLNKSLSGEDNVTLEDFIETKGYGNFELLFNDDHKKQVINNLFSILTERESDALKMSFGFGMTSEFVQKKHGISGERVRQIKEQALRVLRSKKGIKNLVELL